MSETHRPAANVRAEMARRSVRQVALAKHLGLSQAAVSRRVNGETEFSVAELLAVAELLGVSAASLLGEDVAATAGSAA
jgi:transcriptional regulator with XRE-family HTH domain